MDGGAADNFTHENLITIKPFCMNTTAHLGNGVFDGVAIVSATEHDTIAPNAAYRQTRIVVIGRNEGNRLPACLQSINSMLTPVIYVNSGSTDDSVQIARNAGVLVIELDPAKPFTAARARNEGVKAVVEDGGATFVQFVDGDCTLEPDWVSKAVSFLESRSDVALVCGHLRERFPEHSIYNRLCDFEWNTPVGEIAECGGNFIIRGALFREIGGFSSHMVGGEEPELCARLIASGWKIWKIDERMARHDANMLEFGQWWRRMVRNGYAFAEGARMCPDAHSSVWKQKLHRAIAWGGAIPILDSGDLTALPPSDPRSLLISRPDLENCSAS